MTKDSKLAKIAFFFGAGAECDNESEFSKNFNMPNGYDFYMNTFALENFNNKYGKFLKYFFNNKNYLEYKYSVDTITSKKDPFKDLVISMARSKALNDESFAIRYPKYCSKLLTKLELSNIEKNHGLVSDYFDKSQNDIDFEIISEILKKHFKDNRNFKEAYEHNYKDEFEFLDYLFHFDEDEVKLVTNGLLDSYFYTINNPNSLGPNNFSKVINYYWSCYFAIIEPIIDNNELLKSEYKIGNEINYEKILKNLINFTNDLYSVDYQDKFHNSYYSLIRARLNEADYLNCNGVITSNYYKYVEIITDNVAYLNGKLNYFEFPSALEIIDFYQSDKNSTTDIINSYDTQIFFPFIFGQSFLKPIVSSKQIDEYQKMKNILYESNTEYLVVLGYGLSIEDNHINALLKEYLHKGKIIYVTSSNEDNRKMLRTQSENFINLKVEFGNNQKVVENIFDKIEELYSSI